jgi:hypothetical protein
MSAPVGHTAMQLPQYTHNSDGAVAPAIARLEPRES